MFSENSAVSSKTILSTAASLAASMMLVRSIVYDFLPHETQDYIFSGIRSLLGRFSSELIMVIEEFDGLTSNEIYDAAEIYLGTKVNPSTRRVKVRKPEKEKNFTVTMERNEEIVDVFDRVRFKWKFVCAPVESQIFNHRRQFNSTVRSEVRSFELSFHKKYKDKVLSSYFPYILEKSKAIKDEKKTLKLLTANYNGYYDNPSDAWISINLDHPATFETLAIEPDLKKAVMEDLDRFVKRKEFYKSVGKAWKRGYLLYGPPGTGKSSLIAAMANYLNFDVYDLELTSVRCNSELRSLLVGTANRSILVVEDIDCSVDFQDRQGQANPSQRKEEEQNKVTLSGLLNFVDGLWSSCGDERIIVFTTNHKDRLDPALLRPGRMDMHIHMSYCTPGGFKILASNYLGIDDDDDDSLSSKVEEIQGLIKEVVEVTPAEVAEELMKNDNPQIALQCLLQFLHLKQQQKIKSMEAMSSTMAEAAAVVDGRQR